MQGWKTRARRLWWLLVAAALLPVLDLGFLADDFVGLQLVRDQGWMAVVDQLLPNGGEFMRPLGLALFSTEVALVGPRAVPLHLLHLALFVLAAHLTGRIGARLAGEGAYPWAAALALAYPGRVETVAWIAALYDLLALTLVLTALLVFLAAGHGARIGRTVALVAVLSVAAPLAKESAFCLPPILTVLALTIDAEAEARRLRWSAVAASWAGAAAVLGARLLTMGGVGGYADTSMASAAARLPTAAVALVRAVVAPVNPAQGRVALALAVVCGLATAAAAVLALVPSGRRPAQPLLVTGATLTVLGLLPALPYVPADVAWSHSRFLSLSGAGIALMAAAAAASGAARGKAATAVVLTIWTGALTLNLMPWHHSARCREVILDGIEQVTAEPVSHRVWLAGPINQYRGARLLGGHLQHALEITLPGRMIDSDSAFLQRLQGRPVGAYQGGAERLHVFRFDPDEPRLMPVARPD